MNYRSVIIYTSMILDFNELLNRSSLVLPAHGRAGVRATSFLVAHFAKQKTNFDGGTPVVERFAFATEQEARAGKISFPIPFLFAHPSVKFQYSASGFSRKKVRILFRRHSQFVKFRFPASLGVPPLALAEEQGRKPVLS